MLISAHINHFGKYLLSLSLSQHFPPTTAWITCEIFHVLPPEIIIFCNCSNQKHITLFFYCVKMYEKKRVETFHECYFMHFYCITICLYENSVQQSSLHAFAVSVSVSIGRATAVIKIMLLRRVSILHASLFVYIIKWLSFSSATVTTLSAINRIYHVQYLRPGSIDAYQSANKNISILQKLSQLTHRDRILNSTDEIP